MIKVFLTIDPQTMRGLYDDEAKLLGEFHSISEAEETLGEMLNFCTIYSADPSMKHSNTESNSALL